MLRRFFWGLVLAVAFALPASAQTCPKSLPIGSCSSRTLKIPLTASIPSGWTFTRTGNTATYWANGSLVGPVAANVPRFPTDVNGVPLGYLNEPAATNVYLNSQSPATQTITVTAQAYTLSFYGTGTIALTGTYTGTLAGTGASNLVQLTFTPTAGALIATLTGSVTNVQLEAGSFATSRIITTGASVTRNADNLSAPLSLYPWLQTATGYSFAYEFSMASATDAGNLMLFNGPSGAGINGLYGNTSATNTLRMVTIISSVATTSSYYSLGPAGTKQTLAGSVSSSGLVFSLNRAAPISISKPGLAAIPISSISMSNISGSFNLQSLTLRAGPSSAAWLQGGSY